MTAAAVHIEHDHVGIVERGRIGRPAVQIDSGDDLGHVSRQFFKSRVPALNSWSPGPWLGMPATRTIFLRVSLSLSPLESNVFEFDLHHPAAVNLNRQDSGHRPFGRLVVDEFHEQLAVDLCVR